MKPTMGNKTRRIFQISTSDRVGGAERIALTLHEEFNRLGHDSRLAVGIKSHDFPKTLEIPNLENRKAVARLLYRIPDWMRRRGIKGVNRMTAALIPFAEPARGLRIAQGYEDFDFPGTWSLPGIAGFVPDIIHAHNLHGGFFDLRSLPGFSAKRPFIATLHDAWLTSGHCAHSFDCERWLTGCGQCPALDTPPSVPRDRTAENWLLKKRIFGSSRLYVASVSDFLHRKVERSMINPRMARVIHNGVDTSIFRPAPDRRELRRKWAIPEDSLIVVFAAAGAVKNFWKDPETLMESMKVMGLRYQAKEKLILLCVGASGTSKTLGKCEMIFAGHRPNPSSMAECYQIADVYLHPSKADSFPNVILEAMACALPIVATNVGGIPEQVRDGFNGYLCRPFDIEDMAGKCLSILEDPERRRVMGSRSMEMAQGPFSLERQVTKYLDFYSDALEDFQANPVLIPD